LRGTVRVGPNGRPVQNAEVLVTQVGSTSAPLGSVYTARTGGVALTAPIIVTTNDQGEYELWSDTPQTVTLECSDNDGTAHFVGAPTPMIEFGSFTEVGEFMPAPELLTARTKLEALSTEMTVTRLPALNGVGDLFTCPDGKIAYIQAPIVYNSTGGAIVVDIYKLREGEVHTAANRYGRVSAGANAQTSLAIFDLLTEGETWRIVTAGALDVHAVFVTIDTDEYPEFDFVSVRKSGLTVAEQVIYTAPAGKYATIPSFASVAFGGLIQATSRVFNGEAATRNVLIKAKRAGVTSTIARNAIGTLSNAGPAILGVRDGEEWRANVETTDSPLVNVFATLAERDL
jgi:hypothetical protein